VLSRRNTKVCQYFLEVLFLVKIDSSSLLVLSNLYSKELRNLPEVLSIKSLIEHITKLVNLGLVFSGSSNIIYIDKEVKLSCLMDKKT
jgi:hypothetical protein